MTRKADILRQWYREIWEDGTFEAIEGYFVPTPHNQYLVPNFGIDPNEIREWMLVLRKFVTDIRVDVLHTIEEGDWISAMLEITCLDLQTDRPVKVRQQIMIRFDGDKKAESYPAFDFIHFFEQLRQLPENTKALLLSGTRLE